MSKWRDDGGPAFPTGEYPDMEAALRPEQGMSLRDYYAGQALSGMIEKMCVSIQLEDDPGSVVARTALLAYGVADAMLEARKR